MGTSKASRARPVASIGVSAPIPPPGDSNHEEAVDGHARAAAALRAAFGRLQPQGSDAWNFLAAFTHLGDRYGPYQPGASGLSELLDAPDRTQRGRAGRRGRMARRKGGHDRETPDQEQTELEQAMAQVVEAFRFLSARVRTLEERLARQDRPVDGPSWLIPAEELGQWVDPVVAHIVSTTPGGEVLHGDCGEGLLLSALHQAGVTALGVEPRGSLALRALERGQSVTINEVAEEVADRPPASLGGLVLSGAVDRLPLHALIALLSHSRRALTLGAPIVVVTTERSATEARWGTAALDLIDGRPLHAQTWQVLLERAGFVDVAPLRGKADGDARFAVSASTPT